MKSTFARLGSMAGLMLALAGCGGGGGGGTATPPGGGTPGAGTPASLAAANPAASSTANNPRAAFSLVVDAGLAPVTVSSPPVVKFAVIDSSGKHVPGLQLFGATGAPADPACRNANVRFAIAKLTTVGGTAQWQNLISLQRSVGTNPLGYVEGTTDPLPTTAISNPVTVDAAHPQIVGILEEHAADGYYTYKFATDVTDPNAALTTSSASGKIFTNGNTAAKDDATIHRLGMQLCFVDPQTKATVKVNPYLDFKLRADGSADLVIDSTNQLTDARKVVDRASCNECHQNLAAHGGGRVDPNFCVICHNPGSTDYATGNPIDFKLMIHKFHMGKKLTQDYQVQSFVARKKDAATGAITGVDYPQDQRNCVKCHDGSATAVHPTKDGDNWKTTASKNACFACHDDYKDHSSAWYGFHQGAIIAGLDRDNPDAAADSVCQHCHGEAFPKVATASAHAVPEWTLGAKYQYNIHAVTWNADRTVSVEFSVSNPTDGSVYNIQDSKYQYTTSNTAGTTVTKNFVFGRLGLLFGWGTADYTNAGATARGWGSSCTVAPTASPTCDGATGLPKPSSGAGSLITRGQPVAISAEFDAVAVAGTNNHFKVTSTPIPATVSGTGVVALQGRVGPQKDATSSYAVPVKNVVSYFAIGGGGTVVPRRTVVTAEKCNGCHGRNINAHGHGGNRTEPEVCVICHNGNNVLNGTTVAGGVVTVEPDSAHFKRMIHSLHQKQGANYPVMPATLGPTGNYSGLMNCDVCHANGSYKKDQGVVGSSTVLQVDLTKDSSNATITDTDPTDNPVISPKASACSSCHADDTAKNHMGTVGGAVFGTATQADLAAGKVSETCDGCHAPGGLAGVDTMHNLK